jgi:hypothetical protein
MIYKNFVIKGTFEAGVAVGSLRNFLARNGAGELNILDKGLSVALVEVQVHNPLVMDYVAENLAPYLG